MSIPSTWENKRCSKPPTRKDNPSRVRQRPGRPSRRRPQRPPAGPGGTENRPQKTYRKTHEKPPFSMGKPYENHHFQWENHRKTIGKPIKPQENMVVVRGIVSGIQTLKRSHSELGNHPCFMGKLTISTNRPRPSPPRLCQEGALRLRLRGRVDEGNAQGLQ